MACCGYFGRRLSFWHPRPRREAAHDRPHSHAFTSATAGSRCPGSAHAVPGRAAPAAATHGHAIAPQALDNWEYRGTALGLPRFVERLSWKTFQKVFLRDGDVCAAGMSACSSAASVLTVSHSCDAESRSPLATIRVVPARPSESPWPYGDGLLIDYGRGRNRRFDPIGRVRDPLVAFTGGGVELLLGWSYLDLGLFRLATPSFFALERERPLTHQVAPPTARPA